LSRSSIEAVTRPCVSVWKMVVPEAGFSKEPKTSVAGKRGEGLAWVPWPEATRPAVQKAEYSSVFPS
jgi:hypothetical protein